MQAGALPKLVGLLETGPDTAIAEYAADCVCFLAQVTFAPTATQATLHTGQKQKRMKRVKYQHVCSSMWACFEGIHQHSFDSLPHDWFSCIP